jgi:hypothetical protein
VNNSEAAAWLQPAVEQHLERRLRNLPPIMADMFAADDWSRIAFSVAQGEAALLGLAEAGPEHAKLATRYQPWISRVLSARILRIMSWNRWAEHNITGRALALTLADEAPALARAAAKLSATEAGAGPQTARRQRALLVGEGAGRQWVQTARRRHELRRELKTAFVPLWEMVAPDRPLPLLQTDGWLRHGVAGTYSSDSWPQQSILVDVPSLVDAQTAGEHRALSLEQLEWDPCHQLAQYRLSAAHALLHEIVHAALPSFLEPFEADGRHKDLSDLLAWRLQLARRLPADPLLRAGAPYPLPRTPFDVRYVVNSGLYMQIYTTESLMRLSRAKRESGSGGVIFPAGAKSLHEGLVEAITISLRPAAEELLPSQLWTGNGTSYEKRVALIRALLGPGDLMEYAADPDHVETLLTRAQQRLNEPEAIRFQEWFFHRTPEIETTIIGEHLGAVDVYDVWLAALNPLAASAAPLHNKVLVKSAADEESDGVHSTANA